MTEKLMDYSYDNKSGDINIIPVRMDLSRIPASNGAKSRSGWSEIQEMYGTVHPNLALGLLFESTEAGRGKPSINVKPEGGGGHPRHIWGI